VSAAARGEPIVRLAVIIVVKRTSVLVPPAPVHLTAIIDVKRTDVSNDGGKQGRGRGPRPDAVIAELAAGQHGVVIRRQLVAGGGVSAHAIDYRVRVGRLQVLYRGVYRVGPVPAPWEPEMAAVLACGDTAVLSHRSAAAVWGFGPGRSNPRGVDVTISGGHPRPGPGVRVHRVGALPSTETTTAHGIPITTPVRTLFDLAGVVGERAVEQALAEAERRGLATSRQLAKLTARHSGRAGVGAVRRLLRRAAPPAFTRSEAEERFLALIRPARLPAPEVNVNLLGFEVDFLWRQARLVVETDGFAYHASADAFERDRTRNTSLTLAGFRVLRFTWRQLVDEPRTVVDQVEQALAGGRC
jgi:very-short-patch-repair endonuclease